MVRLWKQLTMNKINGPYEDRNTNLSVCVCVFIRTITKISHEFLDEF